MQVFKLVLNFILIWLLGASVFIFSYNSLLDKTAPVSMPFISLGLDDWEAGFVELKGTWVGFEETLYDKNNTVVISCSKNEGFCFERRASIPSSVSSLNSLIMETFTYPIISWSEDIIVYGDDYLCTNLIYSINRHTEEATFKRNLNITSEKDCDNYTDSTHFSGKLMDGFDAYQKFQAEARNKFILPPLYALLFWTVFVLAWSYFLSGRRKSHLS